MNRFSVYYFFKSRFDLEIVDKRALNLYMYTLYIHKDRCKFMQNIRSLQTLLLNLYHNLFFNFRFCFSEILI